MTFVKSTSEPDKIMSVDKDSSRDVGGRVSAIRPVREQLRLIEDKIIVHQLQRLRRHRRYVP